MSLTKKTVGDKLQCDVAASEDQHLIEVRQETNTSYAYDFSFPFGFLADTSTIDWQRVDAGTSSYQFRTGTSVLAPAVVTADWSLLFRYAREQLANPRLSWDGDPDPAIVVPTTFPYDSWDWSIILVTFDLRSLPRITWETVELWFDASLDSLADNDPSPTPLAFVLDQWDGALPLGPDDSSDPSALASDWATFLVAPTDILWQQDLRPFIETASATDLEPVTRFKARLPVSWFQRQQHTGLLRLRLMLYPPAFAAPSVSGFTSSRSLPKSPRPGHTATNDSSFTLTVDETQTETIGFLVTPVIGTGEPAVDDPSRPIFPTLHLVGKAPVPEPFTPIPSYRLAYVDLAGRR